jgi:hypothetical protein
MSAEEHTDAVTEMIEAHVLAMRGADEEARDAIKSELIVLCQGPEGSRARGALESMKRGELLEIQWEIEEVLEATELKAPEPPAPEETTPPEEEEDEAEEDPNRPLTASDLIAVYDDPSAGIMLHRTKNEDRWFLTQVDPMTGQPRTMPLHPEDVKQIKQQLEGSPYWILGA